ncbi:cytidine deaminase [Saccharothrix tamanrassetensis]|uniref:Cytidine deaminase n=1 Tax=Saccharothrix tamanrassetensis TaxID=1051531 RepID=A0A841CPW5_9PSEU|nr:cytidine deaminase [Saccharothrix tamanrassetensis]MBB5957536.1 cytidine deaminase [Saccharothrix tamanrassetensis]
MTLSEADRDLLAHALAVARSHTRWRHHSVAATGRAADGRTFTGFNVAHFAGGPCAELVVLGVAAADGVYELDAIVATDANGVVLPCGRCRQVLCDLMPGVSVIVTDAEAVPVTTLLPQAYRWSEHLAALEQRGR